MKNVKLGIIGVGIMGSNHAKFVQDIDRVELVAVCDADKKNADSIAKKYECEAFYDYKKLIDSKKIDAVIIATPHYDHTTIGVYALNAGLHVLVEKPISVQTSDCKKLISAHKNKKQVFAAMFNQRTDPHYKKIKALIDDGHLGEITRVNWIITDWFRPNSYYSSGGWRATWEGEGGGVLLNQAPHNLDLLQWITGMPTKVTGFCSLGKYHKIEVEDEVTAYLEYPNGATGVFITSTGEAPGTNRLEISGDMGKVIIENGKISFTKNEIGQKKFSKTTKDAFSKPDNWYIDIPANGNGGQHTEIIQNFVDAILDKKELIAPAVEGIHSVELANAILYSSLVGKSIELPLDSQAYERQLKKLINNSKKNSKGKRKK